MKMLMFASVVLLSFAVPTISVIVPIKASENWNNFKDVDDKLGLYAEVN